MKQFKINKNFTNRSEESLDRYLVEISRMPMITPEKEVELDLETIKNINGLTSLDLELNNINSGLDGNSKSKMRITYEDLNKEITDILNGTATKMTK